MQPIQFFAARAEDGVLLPGATVDVFVSGTQTRAALFSDANALAPLENPTSADNGARVFFFTTAGRIDIQIRYGGYLAPLLREVSTVDPADVVNTEVERLRLEVTDGRIYPTKEAGLASGTVANGAFFWAAGSDAAILRTLWFKVDAVTAQHIADDPGLNALAELVGGFAELFNAPNQWPDHTYTLSQGAANVVTPEGRFAKTVNATLTKALVGGRPALTVASTDATEGSYTWRQPIALLGLAVGDVFSASIRVFNRVGTQAARVLVRQLDSAGEELVAARQTFTVPSVMYSELVAKFSGVTLVAGAVSISFLVGVTGTSTRLSVGEFLIAKGSQAQYRPNYTQTINATIAAATAGLQTQISANTSATNLLEGRVEGITEVFDNPNLFTDKDYVKTVATAGLDPAGSGTYTKTANTVLAQITTGDGRKGFTFSVSAASSNSFRWLQTLAAAGLVAGDKFSASVRILGGASLGLSRILVRQFNNSSGEITDARQTYIIVNGVVPETVVKFAGITLDAAAVSVDIYLEANSLSTSLQMTDYMLAKGSVAEYRPATKGRLATSEDLSTVSSIDAEREKWRWSPNIFPDPRFTSSGTSYAWATGAATPIVGKNGQACIETPASASAVNRRTAKLSVANFKSGKISASLVIQEKIGDQGLAGIQLRLVAFDAAGTQLNWTSVGDDAGNTSYYSRYVPQASITSARTLIIADNVPLPPGTTDIAFDIRIATTVQAYLTMVAIREGADTSFKDTAGSSGMKVAYVTPTGNDVSGDGSAGAPFASTNAALVALGGRGTVILRGAEFGKVVQINPQLVTERVEIVGEWTGSANPVIRLSDKLTGISKTAGQIKIYQAAVAGLTLTPNWLYQDGVADARTLIEAGRHQPEHNGRTHRLPFTRIIKATATTLAAALAELDAASDPRCFYEAGVLYFTVDSGGDGTVANLYLDALNGFIAAGATESCGQITLQNLDVRYGGVNTRPFRKSVLDVVAVHGSRSNCWSHAGLSRFGMIEVSCAGSFATDGTGDGVNGHFHANLIGDSLYAHDCNDDGESNHEWGRTRIHDHYCEYNGGTAVAPTYGCDAIYSNGRSFRNQRIAGRKAAAYYVSGAPGDGGNESIAIFRKCRSEEDTVSFCDNSPSVDAYAICEDCESINPTTTAYDVSLIRNCRHTGTGATKTAKVIVRNTALVS